MDKAYERFVKIQDNRSWIRRSFLKKWFANNFDAFRFFYFLVGKREMPILGRYFVLPILQLYYENYHPNSLILPREEIESIIEASSHLFVDPCLCRIFHNNCDAPLYGCLRINFAAQVRQEETTEGLSKEEALSIVRNARKHGLIFSLEQCVRPYQYNICMCCSCCCVPKEFRYEHGLDVYRSGPYLPEIKEHECLACGRCEERCPVSAISSNGAKHSIDIEKCLGCGVCQDSCPNEAITMVRSRDQSGNDREPSFILLGMYKILFEALIVPLVIAFKLFQGSQQDRLGQFTSREKDVYVKQ